MTTPAKPPDVEELIKEARRKAVVFFEELPQDGTQAVDALAKLLLDEGGAVMRMASELFAQAVIDVHAREGKEPEGRLLLQKIHTQFTGGDA